MGSDLCISGCGRDLLCHSRPCGQRGFCCSTWLYCLDTRHKSLLNSLHQPCIIDYFPRCSLHFCPFLWKENVKTKSRFAPGTLQSRAAPLGTNPTELLCRQDGIRGNYQMQWRGWLGWDELTAAGKGSSPGAIVPAEQRVLPQQLQPRLAPVGRDRAEHKLPRAVPTVLPLRDGWRRGTGKRCGTKREGLRMQKEPGVLLGAPAL